MGLPACKSVYARYRDEPDCRHDRRTAYTWRTRRRGWFVACLIWLCATCAAQAETYRILTFNTGLSRDGPGILARDLLRGEDPEVAAVLQQLSDARPDIAVLQHIDFDYGMATISLIQDRLKALGHEMQFAFSALPNTGMPTPFDLNRNGRKGEAKDKQSFGFYSGHAGIAVLSRYPILEDQTRNFSRFRRSDMPDAVLPQTPEGSYYTPEELAILRLHTIAAWDVPVQLPDGILHVLTFHASPPVFDGLEDRNGLRNSEELRFWRLYIEGQLPGEAPLGSDRFVLMGGFNNDPSDGDGLKPELHKLLAHPLLQDPKPSGQGSVARAQPDHQNPPQHDTAQWDDRPGLGNLRIDYVLPSAAFEVVSTAVEWPVREPEAGFGSRHRPVWVDILWER